MFTSAEGRISLAESPSAEWWSQARLSRPCHGAVGGVPDHGGPDPATPLGASSASPWTARSRVKRPPGWVSNWLPGP